jgi:hypothetical protein
VTILQFREINPRVTRRVELAIAIHAPSSQVVERELTATHCRLRVRVMILRGATETLGWVLRFCIVINDTENE